MGWHGFALGMTRGIAVTLKNSNRGKLLLVVTKSTSCGPCGECFGGEWEIETAGDAEEGLCKFERLRPGVVISDFRLPGMNGVEFLARVKELVHTQRIMLTGQADRWPEEAINRPGRRFVTKP